MTYLIPIATTIDEVRGAVATAREAGRTVGFVPTMGALHAGHLRLIEQARSECGFVVVSIFVNPTQFGPSEDFQRYPRTLDDDRALCSKARADLVFAPEASTLYPHGMASTWVEVPALDGILEGASRPSHFRGVATVVLKLFEVVRPDLAYFGRKDYQQLLVITRMVEDLHVPVIIRPVATVREADGLALSSRNRFLDPDQRRAATVLSKALRRARDAVRGGERDANRVRQLLHQTLQSGQGVGVDYAEVADARTLESLVELDPARPSIALVAARVGSVRLIDNLLLEDDGSHADPGAQEQAAPRRGDGQRPEL